MDVTIRLSRLIHGQIAQPPVTFALRELRHSMLVHFGFPPAKVEQICGLVVEKGRCTLSDAEEQCSYLLECVPQ